MAVDIPRPKNMPRKGWRGGHMTTMTMAEVLSIAAHQFRQYEAHHREEASRPGADLERIRDREVKAHRNAEMAEMCEKAVIARPYQRRIHAWMLECFGPVIAADYVERGDRLLEEVFELLQAMGYDFDRIAQVRDYVAARPVGELAQEVGGVTVCLFALCNAIAVDVGQAAEAELARISEPETMAKIRAKQAAKPSMSPLPQ